jgi:hypothetical protein
MEKRISQLKNDFGDISEIRTQVKNFFEILQIRINKLKLFYSELIKNNKTELFVFGLDSLHFQCKLIDIEYDDMKRLFLAINNRMYCEYFKLYKIIVSYISENTFDKKIMELIKVNNFPVYKDLEPFKQYNFETVLEIHENILLMLNATIGCLEGKEHELSFHMVKKNIGLNIDNFISSFSYDIIVIREKINLFITYIEFFHKLHTKQLKRFSNKIQLMYSHVNKDIRFDEEIDKKKNNTNKDNKDNKNIGILDQSSDTDNDISSPSSSNSNSIILKKSVNPLLNLSNNFTVDDETEKMDEAFSSVDSKCDLLLNSNTNNLDIPGVTIDQIEKDPNIHILIQEEEIKKEETIVVENQTTTKDEVINLEEDINLEEGKEENKPPEETQFFGFKPFE